MPGRVPSFGRHTAAVTPSEFMPAHNPDAEAEAASAADFLSMGDNAPRFMPSALSNVKFEIIPGRLSFTMHRDENETLDAINAEPQLFYFSSWMQDSYQPFNSDFGPVNLSSVVQFCDLMHEKLCDKRLLRRHLVYYCNAHAAEASNAAFLLGSYLVLVHKWTPEQAAEPFEVIRPSPFKAFRDATNEPSTFDLKLVDCLKGLQRAVECKFFCYEAFNVDAYDQLDDIDYADAHIICPKFIAFRGPCEKKPPSKYLPIFDYLKVSTVVRLNEPQYDKHEFQAAGLQHHDLYFDDCTSPSDEIVRRFIRLCDAAPDMVAVHCYAGLGRTGTLIAAWIMSKYGWTAREAIGWVRVVRPGSVIGPQQHFLELFERSLRAGDDGAKEDVACAKLARSTQNAQRIAAQITKATDRRVQADNNHASSNSRRGSQESAT